MRFSNPLRATACKYDESCKRKENSNFLLFRQKHHFGGLLLLGRLKMTQYFKMLFIAFRLAGLTDHSFFFYCTGLQIPNVA